MSSVGLSASSGDYSDFQTVSEILREHWYQKAVGDSKRKPVDPEEVAQYLAALCYAKRSKVDPFWIEGVLAGVKDGKRTLTYVDLFGNKFSDKYIATGFARMIAPPIIDASYHEDIPAADAKKIIIDAFRAIIARFKLSSKHLSFVLVTEKEIFEDYAEVQVKFDYEGYKNKEDIL